LTLVCETVDTLGFLTLAKKLLLPEGGFISL